MSARKDRINAILQKLSEGLYERDEIVAVALLAALCGEHAFLLGPPGTAKSLIARRISQAFETEQHFEMLMHRFSTPEDIFGPVSIKELKEDKYVRNTEGYLPQARFAFLDEIWKSSPAILNTLLTIVNERKFHNGTKGVENVPLKSVVAASNETPPPNQGLEALYDRFVVRLHVKPAEQWENFAQMLEAPANAKASLPAELKIKNEEWEAWQQGIAKVRLSAETQNIIRAMKETLAQTSQKPEDKKEQTGEQKEDVNALYVSDRLWQKAAKLMKAAAFFCDREETNLADALLLRHCLWSSDDNRERVVEAVKIAVKRCGFGLQADDETNRLEKEKDNLENEIAKAYSASPVRNSVAVRINGEDCISQQVDIISLGGYSSPSSRWRAPSHAQTKTENYYIPVSKTQSIKSVFSPWDGNGAPLLHLSCNFRNENEYDLSVTSRDMRILTEQKGGNRSNVWSYSVSKTINYSPHHHWDKSADVNLRLVGWWKQDIDRQISENKNHLESAYSKKSELESNLEAPFVSQKDIQGIALVAAVDSIMATKIRLQELKKMKAPLGE